MSEYLENTFDFGEFESIILNTSADFPEQYDIGTYVDNSAEHITASAKDLHALADFIKTHIPEPTVLDTAKFIRGQDNLGTPRTLAKFDGLWYDERGNVHTADWVDRNYDFIEEIA